MILQIQFPTYKRTQKFLTCLHEYVDFASDQHHIHFNINGDVGDLELQQNVEKIHEIVNKTNTTFSIHFDHNSDKIWSINAHIERPFDIVLVASDDMIPAPNWDVEVCTAMSENFPNLDGALHFADGNNNKNLITFSILGVRLYQHFGYIYHPDYKALYCDNEFTEAVYAMNKVKYIDKQVFTHAHYAENNNRNSGDLDLAAKKTLAFSGRDGTVYQLRKQMNFPRHRITND